MFSVTFQTGKRVLQLHCRHFAPSEMNGLFELSGIVFSESKVLLHDEEALRYEFKDVERVLLPWTAILRVDQMKTQFSSAEGPKLIGQEDGGPGPIVLDFRHNSD